MTRILGALIALPLGLLVAGNAQAWHVDGGVFCDANGNQQIDAGEGLAGVVVLVESDSGPFATQGTTNESGFYLVSLPDTEDTYHVSIDLNSLPGGSSVVIPASGEYLVTLSDAVTWARRNFLIDSPSCGEPLGCWMTGGGVKFEPILDMDMAECQMGHGPTDTVGGNVFPSCSPEPGHGGQWNHVAHSLKLHFLGTVITDVRCGNVPGIEEGSESPVTPFNFIEFRGTGTLMGIQGSKFPKTDVSFFARVEDRNEPGSRGANEGADIDRYFLHVFEDPADPMGTTHILVDMDGDSSTVDPILITGGNFQLHISSCEDPPGPGFGF